MNELKRQLNQKMGDTSLRTANVIQKIEAGKKAKRTAKKLKSSGLIYITFASFVTVLALFFLVGPFDKNGENNANNPLPTPNPNDQVEEGNPVELTTKELLRKYFKEDGTVAYFEGNGNEYATYAETTKWITPDYVEVLIDNGGSITQKIYRITDDSIELIINHMAEDGVDTPYVEELLRLEAITIMMVAPFEDGLSFSGQTMKLNVPFKTPYGEFTTTLVESEVKDTIISMYYAEDYGLVGEIYTFSDGSKVESYLASLDRNPVPNLDLEIEVYNESTKSIDIYSINDLPFVDPYLFKEKPEYYNMTYRELFGTDSKNLGVLTYACDEKEMCSHVFVAKGGNSISTITHAWPSYGNIQLSPNNEIVAIPINSTEQSGDSIIERNQVILIDLKTFKHIIPSTNVEYFESAMYPIDSFTLTNNSITMKVADILSFAHEDIAEWQKQTPLKLKELTVPIK